MSNKPYAKIFGISNCSTVKKALIWCQQNNVAYDFHDYKKSGVPLDRLEEWCKTLGWKALINTKGTTWRKLSLEHNNSEQGGCDDGGVLKRDQATHRRNSGRSNSRRL